MSRHRLSALLAGAAVLVAGQAQAQQPALFPANISPVEFAVLNKDNWDRLVPAGKEVDAIYGDIVLKNGEITAVIAAPVPTRNANMTVRDVGGCLIDLTRTDASSDQLSCYYPGQRKFPYREWQAVDERGNRLALDGKSYQGLSVTVSVLAEAAEDGPHVDTRYYLVAPQAWMDIVTTFTNPHDKEITFPLVDDVRIDGGNEDMTKSPDGVADLFTVADHYWQQAYGVMAWSDDRRVQSTNERASVLKFVNKEGQETVTLKPGEKLLLGRRIAPGRNLMEVRAKLFLTPNGTLVPVTVALLDGLKRPIPGGRLELTETNGQPVGVAIADGEGVVSFPIPSGKYLASVKAFGQTLIEPQDFEIQNVAEQKGQFNIAAYKPGDVVAKITDEQGQPIPCKVEFAGEGATPSPNFGPVTAEHGVKNLYYSHTGTFTQRMPAGQYRVIVSHGPEYDALFTTLQVPEGGEAKLEGRLVRSVDTTGWISSDFHSHSSPSGDNTSSQLGRVLNLLCEHVEFCPCTEHNRISTYVPHIEELGIGAFMGTCSGIELTGSPLPLNHQNAFPLHEHPHEQDGGGPVTDGSPETQIERLALWDNRSDKLVQQNHPDMGWLFFDKDGNGEPDEGFTKSLGFMDVIEIHPLDYVLKMEPTWKYNDKTYNHAAFNWLQLLNQGMVVTGVVNTDAHYNFHGSGSLRNWIASPTDDPAKVQPLEIVHASEDRRLVMSNGPFLTMTAREADKDAAVGVGDDLAASSGKVRVRVRVQCANWLDVDNVFLLINGRFSDAHRFTREKNPEMFGDTAVKFDHELDVVLPGDAHLVAVAGSEKRMKTSIYGSAPEGYLSAAITNPIFVDVDGSGFQPNKDTLGAPLPVRRGD